MTPYSCFNTRKMSEIQVKINVECEADLNVLEIFRVANEPIR